MTSLPLPFLLNRAAGLISLIILISGPWFVADWASSGFRGDFWLACGLAMLALALFGRSLVLLSLPRRAQSDRFADLPCDTESVTGSGGALLQVACYGHREAPIMLLTQEWGYEHTLWIEIVRRLSAQYRVIAWDPAGIGRSSRPFDGVYSLDRLANDLQAVITAAGRRPTLLVGQGAGVMINLRWCELFPQMVGPQVKGMVAIDGAAGPLLEVVANSTFLRSVRRPLIDPLLRLSIIASPAFHLMNWASYLNGLGLLITRSLGFGQNPDRAAVDYATWLGLRQAPSVVAKGLQALIDAEAPSSLALGPLPVLAVASANNVLIKPASVKAMADKAGMAFETVPHAGHLSLLTQPEVYADAMLRHARLAFAAPISDDRRDHREVLGQTRRLIEAAPEPRSFENPPTTFDDSGDAGDVFQAKVATGLPTAFN